MILKLSVLSKVKNLALFFLFITIISACSQDVQIDSLPNKPISSSSTAPEVICTEDNLTSTSCKVKDSGKIITSKLGQNLTAWENPTSSNTITARIEDGYYYNKTANLSDTNLDPTNIKSGITIFGVTGSLSVGGYGPCTDEQFNSGQCTTSTNRYVYISAHGGRSSNCGNGYNSTPCWTNATNQYVSSTLGVTVNGANGVKTTTIPQGYYSGATSAVMSDTNLTPTNIKSGVIIFGVAGTLVSALAGCTDEQFNSGQCTTSTNRYVYSAQYGGRSLNCSLGANTGACWTNAANQYVANNLGANVTGADGALSTGIPAGYYNGITTAAMSDSDLLTSNIRSGTTIFGVTGNVTERYGFCTDDGLNAGNCSTVPGRYTTGTLGIPLSGTDGSISKLIPLGFYNGTTSVTMADSDLLAANIKSGITIFGVTGSLSTSYASCTDESFNSPQCTTNTNRYVYSNEYGGRINNCSLGSNSTACWTNAANIYVTNTLGSSINGTNGSLSTSITSGFYDGSTFATMSDSNLISSNIKNGTNIFGTTGTLIEKYTDCTDNASNPAPCSTTGSRYVYSTQYGPRDQNCSLGSNATACWTNAASRYVASNLGADVNASNGVLSVIIPSGYYDGTAAANMSDTNLLTTNIKNGVTVFGVTGSYTGSFKTAMASTALRDTGTNIFPSLNPTISSFQLTLDHEVNTYQSSDLPISAGYNYRDIPDTTKDFDGYDGIHCRYAPRPTTNCGTSQNTIVGRITNCNALNSATSTWDGSVSCNGGQGVWKLVSRSGTNKEVWQDQRTGLLWSSRSSTIYNWCQASGNTQTSPVYLIDANIISGGTGYIGSISGGASSTSETITISFSSATSFTVTSTNGASGCQGGTIISGGLTATPGSTATFSRSGYCSFTITQGSTNFAFADSFVLQSVASSVSCAPGTTLQPASPLSFCAETSGLNPTASDVWSGGSYLAEKGGMGKNSSPGSPSIRWRLPTLNDYKMADINGIRYVMPDMGSTGRSDGSVGGATEWSATSSALTPGSSWNFGSQQGTSGVSSKTISSYAARCVGR